MPAVYTRRVLMVIPIVDLDRARQAAAGFDASEPEGTFTLQLSATGSAPATHLAASVQMRPQTARAVADLVARDFPAGVMQTYNLDDPGAVDAVLAGLGLKRVQELLP